MTWQLIISSRLETTEETSVHKQPVHLGGQQWLLCSLFAEFLPPIFPMFMALSNTGLVSQMTGKPKGQHLIAPLAMLGNFKSNTNATCSLFSLLILALQYCKMCKSSLLGPFSRGDDWHAWLLVCSRSAFGPFNQHKDPVLSHEDGVQHTVHRPEWPSFQQVISAFWTTTQCSVGKAEKHKTSHQNETDDTDQFKKSWTELKICPTFCFYWRQTKPWMVNRE